MRGDLDGVGEEVEQPRARLVAECRRVVGDGGVVEHRQRGVEMIEARVDEFEADNRHPDGRGDLVVRPAVGAKTIARQHDRADDEQVALTLVDVPRLGGVVAVAAHPLGVGGGFACALRVGEPGDDGLAVDQQAAVGGVHHVRQPGDGLDQFDGVAEFLVGLAQALPLVHRHMGVDGRRGVHPRVDGVLDGEERRRRHRVVT